MLRLVLSSVVVLSSAQSEDVLSEYELVMQSRNATVKSIDLADLADTLPCLDLRSTAIGRPRPSQDRATPVANYHADVGEVRSSPVDDFSQEILQLMGLEVIGDVPRMNGEAHPCEQDRLDHCDGESHWINCLAQKARSARLSGKCIDRLQDTLPYTCREEIGEKCKVLREGEGLFQCLQSNFATLGGACISTFLTTIQHVQAMKKSENVTMVHTPSGSSRPLFVGPQFRSISENLQEISKFQTKVRDYNASVAPMGTISYLGIIFVLVVLLVMCVTADMQESIFSHTNMNRAYSKVLQKLGYEKKRNMARYIEAYGTINIPDF